MSCGKGKHQAITEAARVFNGESYREKYQVCQLCPLNSYSESVGLSSCRSCPQHHRTSLIGSTSFNDCISKTNSPKMLSRCHKECHGCASEKCYRLSESVRDQVSGSVREHQGVFVAYISVYIRQSKQSQNLLFSQLRL